MTETVAVIFIFFILVLFGIVFYSKFQQSSIKAEDEKLRAARAMDTTQKALFLPELMCSNGDAEPEDNCFDMMKLRHVNKTFKDNLAQYYFDLFSYARIEVQQVYPEKMTYLLYDQKRIKEGEISNYEPTYFIVALRDETQGRGEANYGFGYVEVGVYS